MQSTLTIPRSRSLSLVSPRRPPHPGVSVSLWRRFFWPRSLFIIHVSRCVLCVTFIEERMRELAKGGALRCDENNLRRLTASGVCGAAYAATAERGVPKPDANLLFCAPPSLLGRVGTEASFDLEDGPGGGGGRALLEASSPSGLVLSNFPPQRRESFLYRSDSEFEMSPKSVSRHSSIGSEA
ncbi:hypothetical protein HPB51_004372 [Rhipicephalus microplus]|uniref:Uncharacterized protein n=1 Tax=Rhipicephalus microplus TaxID=6941 RepID=A0A9J6EKV6_RHIMP|nr:hypothetical protein HPB51_004372 [Rhipicephalus microplus]